MTKSELISAMASETALSKIDCEKALDSVIANITQSLKKGDDVTLIGFGSFSVKDQKARTGRNPRTGDPIQIAAKKAPGFKAGKLLKEAVNG